MRVFTKQHLGILLTFSLFQSAYGNAHGEPLSKKRRLEHSDQGSGEVGKIKPKLWDLRSSSGPLNAQINNLPCEKN